ncbi:dynein axonemal assembly factor 1 homolog [Musca vetustissima]|uniref:dynein axonemal assembly factor 1 homolog n=1 Tax=Musca vetustissima TaxID=27455 RepID=UPI002AB5FA4A|nr:dynein axonemal assembly factor 1 homolog [Musca vetustissima]
MDPQKISELAKLLRNNGDKILSCESTLTLSGSLLRALNDAFTLIADSLEVGEVQNFQVLKPMNSKPPVFRDLQLIHDFVQKTALLCLVHYPGDEYYGKIDISKFCALKRLEVQKIDIKQLAGIQRLRAQLEHLICIKSIKTVDDIITHCGGDNSNGFVWNELKSADFSYNNLQCVDTSLEFAQYLQHLNLRHNKLQSVKAIKWLPHLKTLDLSFNRLTQIPQFHMDACKRLQSLNMSNNLLEDLMGIVKLDALTDLDLSDNFLLDHTYLLPLSALITLKFLNLFGNPLHCHPKHRLATCQYLHKNCSTVKFVLDFETLSKSEKALTGTHQLRQVGALNRYTMRSSSSSISSAHTPIRSSNTPASSVGSLVSFKLTTDNSSESEANCNEVLVAAKQKKKSSKTRCVEIEDFSHESQNNDAAEDAMQSSVISLGKNSKTIIPEETCKEHLETKRQIVELREKYGNEWLHSGNAEIMNNSSTSQIIDIDMERQKSREMFQEYIKDVTGDFAATTNNLQVPTTTTMTSTPTNNTLDNTMAQLTLSPIKPQSETSDSSLYKSLDQTQTLINDNNNGDGDKNAEQTLYKSLDESKNGRNPFEDSDNENTIAEGKTNDDKGVDNVEEDDHLKYVYSRMDNDDMEQFSEREDDEETYIVYDTNNRNEAIFLTKSSNFLRERDPLTEKTKTKWSLKILESCDRLKSNTIRLNFDTVKVDKQERIYTVEEDLCQELEKKLRDILSQRDLSEMNQTIYRCVNCSCQFSQEIKNKIKNIEIRCPDCKSCFVAEIHVIPKSLEKSNILMDKLSPASIVEELPTSIVPLNVQDVANIEVADDTNSIGKGKTRLSTNSLQATTLKQLLKSSATSLNESSCSKITTTNSESSFNSNQSLVGSSNTDRDLDFKTNGESDIDIISNPSQSSIEVLDQFSSRKTSEERRISHIPNLETIDDQSYTQTFLEREFDNMINYARRDKPEEYPVETMTATKEEEKQQENPSEEEKENIKTKKTSTSTLIQQNLTESSSSGSVTDSICTAYEQQGKSAELSNQFLQQEVKENSSNIADTKKEESNNGGLSMFGAPEVVGVADINVEKITAEMSEKGDNNKLNPHKLSPEQSKRLNEVVEKLILSRGGAKDRHYQVFDFETNELDSEQCKELRDVTPYHSIKCIFIKINTSQSCCIKFKFISISALMQSTSILMSSSKKLLDTEKLSNIKSGTVLPPSTTTTTSSSTTTKNTATNSRAFKFNYTDFNDIDHRLKLYFYQTKFEDKDEHFKWIVRGRIYNENSKQLNDGCVVMSTCKLYLMQIYGEENDDVAKWLRPIVTCTVDRLESIQLLPWKIGLAFRLRDWGGFLLLLQDILRTDSLMLFFANNSLPSNCDLHYQPNELIVKRLNTAVMDEQLNMCSVLNGCEITCENAKRNFSICCLLTTDSRLYLSSPKVGWLSASAAANVQHDTDDDLELCVTQFMSNLVEVEHCSDNVFIINFLDETQDKCELWKCTFETAENANTCLNAINQSWEKLFGVPLISA